MTADENDDIDQQIQDMQVTVAEMRCIYEANGNTSVLLLLIHQVAKVF